MLDFERDGVCLFPKIASQFVVEKLREEFSLLDFKAGARSFAVSPLIRELMAQSGCFGIAAARLDRPFARPVRILAFDKTPASNWSLGWHQDRVIAVKDRADIEGFGVWTIKGAIPHVEASVEVLDEMFSLRLQLDDCNAENGALKVLPGSARRGKLTDTKVRTLAAAQQQVTCEAESGDILAMRALTVHASEPSRKPSHRRVLHIDYCSTKLPEPLSWALEI